MRIDVRQPGNGRVGWVQVDAETRPTRAITEETKQRVFLTWDAAIDDAGRLRSCVVCGCRDLYQRRSFPQITGLVVVLAFGGALAGILGLANRYPLLYLVLILVLGLDVASLVFSRKRLICYQCESKYSNLEISRQHRGWDQVLAQKYESQSDVETETTDPERELDTAEERSGARVA